MNQNALSFGRSWRIGVVKEVKGSQDGEKMEYGMIQDGVRIE